MTDPVHELAHDHADLNRRVLEIGAALDGTAPLGPGLATTLEELREQLFLHFAREEEGLFPFVAERLPEHADRVTAMATAHDTICGALARMVYLAKAATPAPRGGNGNGVSRAHTPDEPTGALQALFERFQAAYIEHAKAEAELLTVLDARLDAAQRAQLAELVRDL